MKSKEKNNVLVSFLRSFRRSAKPPAISMPHSSTVENLTSSTVTLDEGSYLFKIKGYSKLKNMEKGQFLGSATFSVGGYDWFLTYYPSGDGEHDGYISIFVHLISSDPACSVKVWLSFTVLDKDGKQLAQRSSMKICNFRTRRLSCGCPSFIRKSVLESSDLKSDCIVVKCTFSFVNDPTDPIVVPPYNIHMQLCRLLETGNRADVTFDVDGYLIAAHKFIIHMRSPAFSEKYFGLTEEKSGTPIKIVDMERVVFNSLLGFIYIDFFPGFEEQDGIEIKQDTRLLTQDLLVVADRYGLERLRAICEEILCDGVDISNVVPTLSFAENHSCKHLKNSCLNTLVSPETLGAVVETEQFQDLVRCHPLILKELLEKRLCN